MKTLLLAISSVILSCIAFSDTISGTFEFDLRKPYVALIYFTDDTDSGPELCGFLDQKNKAFSSRLVASKTDCEVSLKNSDSISHNIFANDMKTGASFDVGLIPPEGSSSTIVNWDEGKVVRVGCKIHPQMRSYIANVPSRRFAIVDFGSDSLSAEFAIDHVPASTKSMVIWFPRMDPISVEVERGANLTIQVTKKGRPYGRVNLKR